MNSVFSMSVVYSFSMKTSSPQKTMNLSIEWSQTSHLRTECEFKRKTMFGVCKTLCDIVEKISERLNTNSLKTPYFKEYVTNIYKLSCFKSQTNLFFVLNTKIDDYDYSSVLQQIYEGVYIDYVKKNFLYEMGEQIDIELFRRKVLDHFQKLYKGISR